MRTRMIVGLVGMFVLGLLALAWPVANVAADRSPIVLRFDKSDPDGNFVWNGRVGGDISGNLETRLLEAWQSGDILHVVFEWDIDADNPNRSFVATLTGTLNLATGAVVMDGRVTEGFLLGARVHEEGQLVDPATSQFKGTIQIMPAGSD